MQEIKLVLSIIVLFGVLLMMTLPVRLHISYRGEIKGQSVTLRLHFFYDLLGLGTDFTVGRQEVGEMSGTGVIKRSGLMSLLAPKKTIQHRRGPDNRYYYLSIKRLRSCLWELMRHSLCRRFVWSTAVGFDDYAATGLAVGLFWGLKSYLVGCVSRRLRFLPPGPLFRVIPRFGKRDFETSLDCILETRLGHIIIQLMKFLFWRFRIFRKRRIRRWKNWATIRSKP